MNQQLAELARRHLVAENEQDMAGTLATHAPSRSTVTSSPSAAISSIRWVI